MGPPITVVARIMNHPNSLWPGAEQFDPTDHDLNNFLNFDQLNNIDFSSLDYNPGGLNEHGTNHQLADLAHSLNGQHLQNDYSPHVLPNHSNGGGGVQLPAHTLGGGGMPHYEFNMPQYGQDHMYRPRTGVPPTPNSVEMHGDPTRYMQQMGVEEAMFDQGFLTQKADAVCRRAYICTR